MNERPTETQVFTIADVTMGKTANGTPVINVTDHTGRVLSRFERTSEDLELRFSHLEQLKGHNIKAVVSDPNGRYPGIRSYERTTEEVTPGIAPYKGQQRASSGGGARSSPDQLHATLINTCIMQARELVGSGVPEPLEAAGLVATIASSWYSHFSKALPQGSGKALGAKMPASQPQVPDEDTRFIDDNDIPF